MEKLNHNAHAEKDVSKNETGRPYPVGALIRDGRKDEGPQQDGDDKASDRCNHEDSPLTINKYEKHL